MTPQQIAKIIWKTNLKHTKAMQMAKVYYISSVSGPRQTVSICWPRKGIKTKKNITLRNGHLVHKTSHIRGHTSALRA